MLAIPQLTPAVLREAGISWRQDDDLSDVRYSALLVLPLMINQDVYGVIALYFAAPKNFTDEEIGTAVSLADQAALAIENARLYQRAEQAAVMEERERLARELHDSVTQSLYSLMLFSEAGQRLNRSGETARVQEYLSQLSETAQQALKEMRLLLFELRPSALEHDGLIRALQKRLDAVEKRAGVRATLDVQDSIVLPPLVEEALYRIAQEALNNALKHASATIVHVRIAREESSLILQVTDDGRGFVFANARQTGGMGLETMHERVRKLGGQLHIQTKPNEGTTITVRLEQADALHDLGADE
jgi:signal transduction histidine kinase